MTPKVWALIAAAVLIGIGAWLLSSGQLGGWGIGDHSRAVLIVNVKVPTLGETAALGEMHFNKNCVECHGKNAGGTDQGPPLIHKIYEPNHHGDHAFRAAIKAGVRSHHWRFGNMPPQPQIKNGDVEPIIDYVRTLQKENGIF